MAHLKKNAACFCGRACVYHLIRCDVCHQGVHFACVGMTLAEAAQKKVFICGACEDTVQEENVAEQLNAEGRPAAVVFTTTCRHHNGKTGRRRDTSTMTALVRPNEVLSKARCDVCDHRCTFDFIQCDECEAWCHYACAEMTPKLAASSGKWYCRRCLRKEDAEKGRHSVVGQLKRQARSAGADYTQKKTRLDVASSGFDAEPPLELDLEDELDIESKREDELELYLSDASELDLDLDDDADLETARNDERELELYLSDASELELDLEEEPELKREDYVELVLDLDDEPELEMKREDDNELVLDLGEDLEDESLKKEPCSWT